MSEYIISVESYVIEYSHEPLPDDSDGPHRPVATAAID